MSYCRWSTDNFECDLYCYEDVRGGWTTHVASNRHVGVCPPLRDRDMCDPKEFIQAIRAQSKFLDEAERVAIGLPHDGETFNDPTLEDFRARLVALREAGYRFPESVLANVDADIAGELA